MRGVLVYGSWGLRRGHYAAKCGPRQAPEGPARCTDTGATAGYGRFMRSRSGRRAGQRTDTTGAKAQDTRMDASEATRGNNRPPPKCTLAGMSACQAILVRVNKPLQVCFAYQFHQPMTHLAFDFNTALIAILPTNDNNTTIREESIKANTILQELAPILVMILKILWKKT